MSLCNFFMNHRMIAALPRVGLCVAFFVTGLGTSMNAFSQSIRTLGKIEVMDPSLEKLLAKDASIEILADGFTWTEGPVWIGDAKQGHLLFSDIPRNSIFIVTLL